MVFNNEPVDVVLDRSYLPPRLIHQTVYEVLRRLSHIPVHHVRIKFKKTGMCVHYTALNFIYYLQNNIIGNSAQIEVNINGEMKSFKAVDDNYKNYIHELMDIRMTHIYHHNFDDNFKFFYNSVKTIMKIIFKLWNKKLLSVTDDAYISTVYHLRNKLALDLLLNCEVPVSKFKQYTYADRDFFKFFAEMLSYKFIESSSSNTGSLIFNAWAAFVKPDQERSMSCYVNRLLILFASLNEEADNVSWRNSKIGDSLENILKSSFSIKNKNGQLLMSTDENYFNKWKELNKHTAKIIEFLFSYMENIPEQRQENLENIFEFFEQSLLQCKVPLTYLFNFDKTFLKLSRNPDFFDSNYPYTVGCFKQSIINMFKELTELNTNCVNEFEKFLKQIMRLNSSISQKIPYDTGFGKYVLYLDEVGTKTLKNFDDCIDKGVEDILFHEVAISNILSKFQNFYKSCGAPPVMMNVYWNEMNFNDHEIIGVSF